NADPTATSRFREYLCINDRRHTLTLRHCTGQRPVAHSGPSGCVVVSRNEMPTVSCVSMTGWHRATYDLADRGWQRRPRAGWAPGRLQKLALLLASADSVGL